MIVLALLVIVYFVVVFRDEDGRAKLRKKMIDDAVKAADRYFQRRRMREEQRP